MDETTNLHLRLIANKNRLQVRIPGAPDESSPYTDPSTYREELTEILRKEYMGIYLHPALITSVIHSIDRTMKAHITDVIVKEEIDRIVEGAILEALQ